MREAGVVAAFSAWLEQIDWSVQREVEHVDVVAEREGIRLYAEAQGRDERGRAQTSARCTGRSCAGCRSVRTRPQGSPWWCPSTQSGPRCVSGRAIRELLRIEVYNPILTVADEESEGSPRGG
jgi:hypothetical protein